MLVCGDLGAGKTTFVRGACHALGVEAPVTSPSFALANRYRGSVPVAHLDLYRLATLEQESPGLLDDYVDADTVTFVEWPLVLEPELQSFAFRVTLKHGGGDRRLIEICRSSAQPTP